MIPKARGVKEMGISGVCAQAGLTGISNTPPVQFTFILFQSFGGLSQVPDMHLNFEGAGCGYD